MPVQRLPVGLCQERPLDGASRVHLFLHGILVLWLSTAAALDSTMEMKACNNINMSSTQ
jgi:hypothetical protein